MRDREKVPATEDLGNPYALVSDLVREPTFSKTKGSVVGLTSLEGRLGLLVPSSFV